jgi:hypothetical protein
MYINGKNNFMKLFQERGNEGGWCSGEFKYEILDIL